MKQIIPLILLFLTFSDFSKAQISPCGTDDLLEEHLQRFPSMEAHQQELERFIQNYRPSTTQQREIITIPVVVHVLYNSEEENISDVQINAQIEVLNEDFRLLNENVRYIPGEFDAIAADTELEFCLASLTPDQEPTNGINRVQTSYTCIGDIGTVRSADRSRLFYSEIGGADAWDTNHYLNIWIGNTCNAFIGLSTNIAVPNFAPEEDGIVIDYQAFGNNCSSSSVAPYHLGRTATHEIGHFLGLRHPWGDCDGEDPDFVSDTPKQEEPYYGCPSYPQISCGGSDIYMNFMNYTDDACMAMFTLGQKERMLATLAGPRLGLTESVGCAFLNPTLPFASEAIEIYPNPATNCIHIDFDAEVPGDVEVIMSNAQGQIIYQITEGSRNFRSIDASRLSNGIYFVSFYAAKQTITKKVMIAK